MIDETTTEAEIEVFCEKQAEIRASWDNVDSQVQAITQWVDNVLEATKQRKARRVTAILGVLSYIKENCGPPFHTISIKGKDNV